MREKKKQQKTEETRKEGRWLKPWVQVLLMLLFGGVGERDGREVERERGGGRERKCRGGVSSGCYFLAFAPFAEFRGGVTGRPEPMPPPPP